MNADRVLRPEPVRGKVGADWDRHSLTSHGTYFFLSRCQKQQRSQSADTGKKNKISSRVEREANADMDKASRPEPIRGKDGTDWDRPSLTLHN